MLLPLALLASTALASTTPMACPGSVGVHPLDDLLWPACYTQAPFAGVGLCPPHVTCPQPCGEVVIDPEGTVVRTRRFEWSRDGKLLATHTTQGGEDAVVRYTWRRGRLQAMEDAGGRTNVPLDEAGRVESARYEAAGLTRTETYERDADGRIVQSTFSDSPEGLYRYEYGPDGRLAAASRGQTSLTFRYDDTGHLVGLQDGELTRTWRWGARGQVEAMVERWGNGPARSTTYSYDDQGGPLESRSVVDGEEGAWVTRWLRSCP
jgi:hypothetical protein